MIEHKVKGSGLILENVLDTRYYATYSEPIPLTSTVAVMLTALRAIQPYQEILRHSTGVLPNI